MKKLKLLLTIASIAVLLAACNMVPWEDIVSLNVTPTLIKKVPKLYPGGNAECSTIGIEGLVETTGRVDYDPSTDSFDASWPVGLLVKVFNGKSVSFQIDGAIDLGDGKCYKVGAVIVKGSDASNVYDYTDIGGASMDAGLTAPVNASGTPSGLSNLTFCFMECPEEELYAVVKLHYWVDGDPIAKLGKSGGEYIYKTGGWCESWMLGVSKYPSTFPLHAVSSENVIGMAYVNNGVVTLDLNDGLTLDFSYLFVGTMDQLLSYTVEPFGCPDFSKWSFNDVDGNTQTFTPGL